MKFNSEKLRSDFLKFFEKKGHTIVPSSSLLPPDPSVLLTTAGMQQFKNYYLGEPSPYGKRVTSCQKCFRTSDIDEVGDATHLTFFEMLGNFSFGDYFKKETIEWAFEFLTKHLSLPQERLYFTFFKGDEEVPQDKQSKEILLKIGVKEEKIFGFGKKENFWGPTGKEGPCGPTVEIHYDLTKTPCEKKQNCQPNCECGRFVEIWNLVFNEYYKDEKGKLSFLEQKGVDTGMGLERLVVVCGEKSSVFETDLFFPLIQKLEEMASESYSTDPRPFRIIADHIKGAVFLISDGVLPSNVEEGYVLRRILRRAMRFGKLLNLPEGFLLHLAKEVIKIYQTPYPEVKKREEEVLTVIENEREKFSKTLEKGLKQFEKIASLGEITGEDAFYLYETYGFPLELTEELAREKGLEVDVEGFKEAFERHREISRAGAEKKFGGIGKEASYQAIKLHTATHLLHSALRKILGQHVRQMGSDITPERLRFDFSHPTKLSKVELERIENLVNEKIKQNLEVKREEMSYEEALKSGALAFFKEKYPERVSVYSILEPSGEAFSKEICAGPHVKRTGELGRFKIIKEESVGRGVRRIRAILE